jgi:hypothetical protein
MPGEHYRTSTITYLSCFCNGNPLVDHSRQTQFPLVPPLALWPRSGMIRRTRKEGARRELDEKTDLDPGLGPGPVACAGGRHHPFTGRSGRDGQRRLRQPASPRGLPGLLLGDQHHAHLNTANLMVDETEEFVALTATTNILWSRTYLPIVIKNAGG